MRFRGSSSRQTQDDTLSRLTGELDRVGVARVEDYLDQVDALTPLNLKLKTVPDIDEGVSPEKGQGVAAQLAGNYPSNHLKTPCSPNSFPTAALRLASVVWV